MFNKKTWILRVVMMGISLTVVLYAHHVLKSQKPDPNNPLNLLLNPSDAQHSGVKARVVTPKTLDASKESSQK